jgi:hypothetical protein
MNRRKKALHRLRGEPERSPGVYSWTRRWMFEWARFLNPGFKIGKYVRIEPGDMWLIQTLYGPRVQRFRKDHGKPGQIWNPRRWGGAILGLEIGCRG